MSSKPPAPPPPPSSSSRSTSPTKKPRPTSPTKNPSPVWKYFTKGENENTCNLCQRVFQRGTSTTPLISHLEKVHGIEEGKPTEQARITDTFNQEPTAHETRKMHEALIKWIIEDYQSFNVVESPAFREFIALFRPRYSIPHRQWVSKQLVENLPQVQQEIKRILETAPGDITLTTDGWTSKAARCYVVITAHWISMNWDLEELIIAFEKMDESHTGETLGNRIIATAEEYGITKKISGIVSDNANNAQAGNEFAAQALSGSRANVKTMRCLPHILQLVANEGLRSLSNALPKLKTLVSTLRSSPKLLNSLRTICPAHEEKYRKPQTDTPTRWNSTYTMIERMVGMKKSIRALGESMEAKKKSNIPTEQEWEDLELVCDLLRPFYDATVMLSSERSVTISMGAVIAKQLETHLREFKGEKKEAANAMLKKLGEYWEDIRKQSLLPSFLDPRTFNLLTDEDKVAAIKELKPMLLVVYPSPIPPSTPSKPKPLNFLEASFLASKPAVAGIALNVDLAGYDEIARYLTASKLDHVKEKPLDWWFLRQDDFKQLAKVARSQLAKMVSSVPSERAFSAAQLLVSEKRTNLGYWTVEAAMLTQSVFAYQRKHKTI